MSSALQVFIKGKGRGWKNLPAPEEPRKMPEFA
jgi:hypothetical protein